MSTNGTPTPEEHQHEPDQWLCRCECGREVVVCGECLRSGRIQDCGCGAADAERQEGGRDG